MRQTTQNEIERLEASGEFIVYHTSGELISKIRPDSEYFGSGLWFANEPYVMTGANTVHTYAMILDDDSVIDEEEFFSIVDDERLADVLAEIRDLYDVELDTAQDMLIGRENGFSLGVDDCAEKDWELQGLQMKAARALGYKGVSVLDEQGIAYLIDMSGREDELMMIAANKAT